jgi:hypothetical protein
MIEPNQDPVYIFHITDLFTTAARLAGALDKIPDDRVEDGLDQTALLLLREGHGRRHMTFHYSGGVLVAVRYRDFAVSPIQIALREHMLMIRKFPHRASEVTPDCAELTPHY